MKVKLAGLASKPVINAAFLAVTLIHLKRAKKIQNRQAD